jgi:hypothetical protein
MRTRSTVVSQIPLKHISKIVAVTSEVRGLGAIAAREIAISIAKPRYTDKTIAKETPRETIARVATASRPTRARRSFFGRPTAVRFKTATTTTLPMTSHAPSIGDTEITEPPSEVKNDGRVKYMTALAIRALLIGRLPASSGN